MLVGQLPFSVEIPSYKFLAKRIRIFLKFLTAIYQHKVKIYSCTFVISFITLLIIQTSFTQTILKNNIDVLSILNRRAIFFDELMKVGQVTVYHEPKYPPYIVPYRKNFWDF